MLVALILAFLIFQIRLDYLESILYDARMRLRPAPAASGHIETVLINLKTIEALKGAPGFAEHDLFLQRLASVEPKAIVYDMSILSLRGDGAEQARFLQTAERIPQLIFLTDQLEMKGEEPLKMPPPFQNLRLQSGPKSSDSSNFAKDSVTRRFLIRYQDQVISDVSLARLFRPNLGNADPIRGQFDFLGTDQAYINFRPPGSYPASPFAAVMEKRMDLETFRDKIVIIGEDTQVAERDYARTPYSRDSIGMTSAEVHANIIDTLLRNDSPLKSPLWFDALWAAAISILTVYVVFAVKPAQGLLILLGTMTGFSVLSFFAFWLGGLWMNMAHPLLAVFLCYYFLIPYRLIIENRYRWEIYQKHKLLQQVEELKTNFISMMSHDLKTPIARIQGMTDVIERDSTPLSTDQREALDTVRSSSSDLLKFINAILQYGSIESQHIQLRRASKDVNDLIDSAIKQNEFLAKLKRIQIKTELEPLFPISIDPELIRQVFSNLIENAVKYSPEDTKILVSSEEQGDFVVVQIADQGPGIPPEELPNLFMKFFRSRQAKVSTVKGSGLGLYLARYFTELHDGTVSVESSYGQGTTFTVKLPLSTGGSGHVESTRR
ncbi:MAG: CHASE2 domain-containing protein [Bdellovibrionaceae bacterium]|nr:CHASE2 domain-containing protein [Pseudobdellovibrionaceae bacterium]